MKTVLLVLGIVFAVLTFAGAGYVLYTGGRANAGFAVIPMVFCLAFFQGYRVSRKRGSGCRGKSG